MCALNPGRTLQYRGNELTREKFYVNLCTDDRVAKHSFPGFQWEAMERLNLPRSDPRSTSVVDLAARLDRALGYKSNECIGTLYQRQTDFIGARSDKPLDLANQSWIINISLGDHRVFRMLERSADEQTEWIAKNKKAANEMYEKCVLGIRYEHDYFCPTVTTLSQSELPARLSALPSSLSPFSSPWTPKQRSLVDFGKGPQQIRPVASFSGWFRCTFISHGLSIDVYMALISETTARRSGRNVASLNMRSVSDITFS